MRDLYSHDVQTAARLANDFEGGDDDRPTLAEVEADERWMSDPYSGICGGCDRPAKASDEGGSCVWKMAVWHPSCKELDKRKAT